MRKHFDIRQTHIYMSLFHNVTYLLYGSVESLYLSHMFNQERKVCLRELDFRGVA